MSIFYNDYWGVWMLTRIRKGKEEFNMFYEGSIDIKEVYLCPYWEHIGIL